MSGDLIWSTAHQGSEEWLEVRKGRITASRFKDAREKLKNGEPSGKAKLYAFDVARQRVGGTVAEVYQNAAMRFGQEQEPLARMEYEARTGQLVMEAGFAHTPDGAFGVSVDGLIGTDGLWECKTMVSSDTLFTAVVDGDISAYRDQCVGALWLTGRKWCDLTLWAPDLAGIGRDMTVIRIERDEAEIERLADDLTAFWRRVQELELRLRGQQTLSLAA
jgi:exodeoxyribonuclease (lambda-induced)